MSESFILFGVVISVFFVSVLGIFYLYFRTEVNEIRENSRDVSNAISCNVDRLRYKCTAILEDALDIELRCPKDNCSGRLIISEDGEGTMCFLCEKMFFEKKRKKLKPIFW